MNAYRQPATPTYTYWEPAIETSTVKVRWFGLLLGYAYANFGNVPGMHSLALNAILTLGAFYTILDTLYSRRERVFLGNYPFLISVFEALFIGWLCYFDRGLESPFRYYYILSLICCAIRQSPTVTLVTCLLHSISYYALFMAVPLQQRDPFALWSMLVVLSWVTWAATAMATLIKTRGIKLAELNAALHAEQSRLEARIAQTRSELQEAQALLLHQEKMAAFGLLAAGIAHEVGNPLTSISSIVQMLKRRDPDAYTRERLELVGGQLQRIQTTLRELINFSRPASSQRSRVSLAEIIHEALNIAKYYKDTKSRQIIAAIPADLPVLVGVRDQLVQVVLNLVLNAIDATSKDGRIEIAARLVGTSTVELTVSDNGTGITPAQAERLFQPYFTTKKTGTGLGLFVTRKLIDAHGGTIEFSSEFGRGTTFTIRLPVPTSPAVPASTPDAPASVPAAPTGPTSTPDAPASLPDAPASLPDAPAGLTEPSAIPTIQAR
jgi:two-component system NtrC family sensor kinase